MCQQILCYVCDDLSYVNGLVIELVTTVRTQRHQVSCYLLSRLKLKLYRNHRLGLKQACSPKTEY